LRSLRAQTDRAQIVAGGAGRRTGHRLGLAKYYVERARYEGRHEQIEIRVDVIDRVAAWVENVAWIKDEIANTYTGEFGKARDWPARFDAYSYSLNFADLNSFANLPSIFQKDIFVLNFVVSEVFDLNELRPIMNKMVEGCASGAHFLFVDRADQETSKKVQTLIEALQLKIECAAKTKGSMDTDEDKSEVELISEFLGGRQPRLTWNAEWVLAAKPPRQA
jgi:hypothetical protein